MCIIPINAGLIFSIFLFIGVIISGIYKNRYVTLLATFLFLYIPDSITVINKKIENIDPAFIGIMHNQKDWEIKE